MTVNPEQTTFTRKRYNTLAALYDAMEFGMERRQFQRWRQHLWQDVQGPRVLEIGVGTGKNIPFYPPRVFVTGIDLAEKMLAKALLRMQAIDAQNNALLLMDAQTMAFSDATFDEVVSTFVFCSVPDPVLGLKEALRVVKPGGRLLMLEHMLAEPPTLARAMTYVDPAIHWMMGVHIARPTVAHVTAAGWLIDQVTPLSYGAIFRRIIAHKPN